MDYEEILDRFINDEEIGDEEWEFLCGKIEDKIKNGEFLEDFEIKVLSEGGYIRWSEETSVITTGRHGWIELLLPVVIDNNYYGLYAWYHDDYGIDYEKLGIQILPKIEKKLVMVEKWVEVEK